MTHIGSSDLLKRNEINELVRWYYELFGYKVIWWTQWNQWVTGRYPEVIRWVNAMKSTTYIMVI